MHWHKDEVYCFSRCRKTPQKNSLADFGFSKSLDPSIVESLNYLLNTEALERVTIFKILPPAYHPVCRE